MTHDVQVDYYIHANQWQSLEKLLKSENGFINSMGARCVSHPNFLRVVHLSDLPHYSSDLSRVCWEVYQASLTDQFKAIPIEEHAAARNVIIELRRLYHESEKKLEACSIFHNCFTRVYDLYYKFPDGYNPIARLEKLVF